MKLSAAVDALSALAHATRLAIFRLLVERAPDGAVAGEIAEHIGVSATTLSFHLKALAAAGLVAATQEGRFQRYRADISALQALTGYLSDACCAGNPGRCAPRKLSARTTGDATATPRRRPARRA